MSRIILGTKMGSAEFLAESGGGQVTAGEEYRRYAAECMAIADRLANPNDKARLVQMAQAFLELADRREVLDPQTNRT